MTAFPDDTLAVAKDWLDRFAAALAANDADRLASLFRDDSHWRDVLAFTWHLTTVNGASALAKAICETQTETEAFDFEIDPDRTPPRVVTRAGTETLETIFRFETKLGRGSGVFRLVPGTEGLAGWTFHTALQELKGHKEQVGWNRPKGEILCPRLRGTELARSARSRTGI